MIFTLILAKNIGSNAPMRAYPPDDPVQEESRFSSQRCPLDCTIVEGCRTPAAPTMSWILALNQRKKVAVYRSDVSGAFDRVRAERLLEKTQIQRKRSAQVAVEGQRSDKMLLKNWCSRAPFLDPTFWNLLYEDARRAIHEA